MQETNDMCVSVAQAFAHNPAIFWKKEKERKKTKIVFSILIKWGRRGRGGCSKNWVTWLGDTKFFARKEGGGGLQLFYYFTIQFNRIYIFRSSVFWVSYARFSSTFSSKFCTKPGTISTFLIHFGSLKKCWLLYMT